MDIQNVQIVAILEFGKTNDSIQNLYTPVAFCVCIWWIKDYAVMLVMKLNSMLCDNQNNYSILSNGNIKYNGFIIWIIWISWYSVHINR